MRTYELTLAGGTIVTQCAYDSWEATCAVAARTGKRVVSFRLVDNDTKGEPK